ncbi:MAG: AraC family ligand binding domain-containing protein [Pirellulaceae bacterium]
MTRQPAPFQSPGQTRTTPVPPDVRAHGLWAFESRHDSKFVMPATIHPFFKLLLIREGAGGVEIEGEQKPCRQGDLIIVPANIRHRVVDLPRSPLSLYGLGVSLQQLPSVVSILEDLQPGVYGESMFRTLRIEQRLRKLLYLNDQNDAAGQLSSIATALDLLAELSLALNPPRTRGALKTAPSVRHAAGKMRICLTIRCWKHISPGCTAIFTNR